MTPFIEVTTTLPEPQQAEQLAALLLEKRLVACVQQSPCVSRYHWQGAVETDEETVCTMKTRTALFDKLCQTITAMHPYEVPEILATPILNGNQDYLSWLDRELAQVN